MWRSCSSARRFLLGSFERFAGEQGICLCCHWFSHVQWKWTHFAEAKNNTCMLLRSRLDGEGEASITLLEFSVGRCGYLETVLEFRIFLHPAFKDQIWQHCICVAHRSFDKVNSVKGLVDVSFWKFDSFLWNRPLRMPTSVCILWHYVFWAKSIIFFFPR